MSESTVAAHPEAKDPALDEIIETRARDIASWLTDAAPFCDREQKHLDEGTIERAYWHHGYLMALRDLQCALKLRRARPS
ncbi:MAG TPA: hypothetical protein VHW66_06515 [Stellaceae bacterium]|jgi:hypothetical protein|nr:hypothetical protein [Stellaceae bacterium]